MTGQRTGGPPGSTLACSVRTPSNNGVYAFPASGCKLDSVLTELTAAGKAKINKSGYLQVDEDAVPSIVLEAARANRRLEILGSVEPGTVVMRPSRRMERFMPTDGGLKWGGDIADRICQMD